MPNPVEESAGKNKDLDKKTQALYSKSEDLICIIGPNRFQNNLLAKFLENETGFRISSYRKMTLSPIIDNSDYVSMILLDHSDIEGIRIRLSSNCEFHTNKVRVHVALFNVFRNQKNLEEVIKLYIQQGVHGIFYNDDPLPIMVKGIRAILNGELWFPRNILSVALSDTIGNSNFSENTQMLSLTSREKEILKKLSTGVTNTDIAEDLYISLHTVKSHLYNLYRKINVSTRLQATLWAHKNL